MESKKYYLHYKDNGNSWGRIMMLFNLYWPGLKKDFISFALYPFTAYIIVILVNEYTHINESWLIEGALVAALFTSPMMLAKKDYRQISAQLPVTTTEKFGFLLLAFLIVVPMTLWISLKFGKLLCKTLFHTSIDVPYFNIGVTASKMGVIVPNSFAIILLSVCFISVVLYWVVKAKDKRNLAVILGFFGLTFFFMFVSMIMEIIGESYGYFNLSVEQWTNVTGILISTLCVLIGSIFLIKLYKRLRNSGF